MASKSTIARIVALMQAAYPTRRLSGEMLSLTSLAYGRALADIADDVAWQAAHVLVVDNDSRYRDWPSPGELRAEAERIMGRRIGGYEAAVLIGKSIKAEAELGDYTYRLSLPSGLDPFLEKTLREAVRRFGLRRFAEMPEEKRLEKFADVYEDVAREMRREYILSLVGHRQEAIGGGNKP